MNRAYQNRVVSWPSLSNLNPARAALSVLQSGPRLLGLLTAAERLAARITQLVEDIDATHRQIALLSERVDVTSAVAAGVTSEAAATVERLVRLLDSYEPALHAAQPVVEHTAKSLGTVEADALMSTLDRTPALLDAMENDLLPTLQTLKTVGPDMSDLLDSSRTLNEMLGGLPGLGRIKKRLDHEADDAASDDEASDTDGSG